MWSWKTFEFQSPFCNFSWNVGLQRLKLLRACYWVQLHRNSCMVIWWEYHLWQDSSGHLTHPCHATQCQWPRCHLFSMKTTGKQLTVYLSACLFLTKISLLLFNPLMSKRKLWNTGQTSKVEGQKGKLASVWFLMALSATLPLCHVRLACSWCSRTAKSETPFGSRRSYHRFGWRKHLSSAICCKVYTNPVMKLGIRNHDEWCIYIKF